MTNAPPPPTHVSDVTIAADHVREEFRANAARTPPRTVGSWHPDRVANLAKLLARPELRPLADGIAFGLHEGGLAPWMLRDGLVSLHPSIADQSGAASAMVLRHALEVALLDQLLPNDDAARIAGLGLACHAARGYLDGLTAAEREEAQDLDRAWTEMLIAPCIDDAASLLEHLREHAATLFRLRAWDAPAAVERFRDAALQRQVLGRLTALLPLALPTERLLTLGGDSRLPIDPITGLNRYGCSPKPRPWAHTFSSCTATSVSEIGFRTAERSRQRLIAAVGHDDFEEAFLDHSESIRRSILRWLHLDLPGTELVLTSSGTDAELLALYFACGQGDAPITSVVLAPTEVGTGTVPAAGGRHFDSLTPHGRPARPGAPVTGLPTDRLELIQIPVRREDGAVIAAPELDAVIEATVRDRCERGGTVLLSREASPWSTGGIEGRLLTGAHHGVYDLDDALFEDTVGWRRVLGKRRKVERAAALRNDHRLVALAQRLPSAFQIRMPVDEVDLAYISTYLLNDAGGYLFLPEADRPQGRAARRDRASQAPLQQHFDAVWERAERASMLQTLNI